MATQRANLPAIFGALSDPTRLAVVERLVAGPASVSELAAPFNMAGPSFLKHLKVLEEAGLAESRKEGRVRTLSLRADALRIVDRWTTKHRTLWEHRLDALGHFLAKGSN